jgi:hypothetical protein
MVRKEVQFVIIIFLEPAEGEAIAAFNEADVYLKEVAARVSNSCVVSPFLLTFILFLVG